MEKAPNLVNDPPLKEIQIEVHGSDCSSSVVDSEDLNIQELPDGANVQLALNSNNNIQLIGNVDIVDSSNIILGNVTYVTGPVYITRTEGSDIAVVNQHIINKQKYENSIAKELDTSQLRILSRKTWLAVDPTDDYIYIKEPVNHVVISHTASEIPMTKRESKSLIRNIQYYHIHARDFNDIAYNFLIGGCGNVFEGRGWGKSGRHAKGYNERSVGISFIGCFMMELPPQKSLDACKVLIKKGVELGYISPSYRLVGHCQCSSTESPGKMLYEEIQTWPHFSLNG